MSNGEELREVAMVTFANTPTFQSDKPIDLGVSDDGEALTLTFSGFEVPIGDTNRARLADWSPMGPRSTAKTTSQRTSENTQQAKFAEF